MDFTSMEQVFFVRWLMLSLLVDVEMRPRASISRILTPTNRSDRLLGSV
jgi:hypothetical protein